MTTPTNPTPTVSDPLTTMDLSDITNGSIKADGDWEGTGIFDVLMHAVNKNVTTQYAKSRINSNDFANVYLGSIQAVLQQSIEYSLRKDLTAAQIDGALKDNLLKDEQLLITAYEREHIQPKSLEKLLKEIALIESNTKLSYTERVIKDKSAAELGLDDVVKTFNTTPPAVYTPQYKETP